MRRYFGASTLLWAADNGNGDGDCGVAQNRLQESVHLAEHQWRLRWWQVSRRCI